jgi:hypothetical protein
LGLNVSPSSMSLIAASWIAVDVDTTSPSSFQARAG